MPESIPSAPLPKQMQDALGKQRRPSEESLIRKPARKRSRAREGILACGARNLCCLQKRLKLSHSAFLGDFWRNLHPVDATAQLARMKLLLRLRPRINSTPLDLAAFTIADRLNERFHFQYGPPFKRVGETCVKVTSFFRRRRLALIGSVLYR